MGIPRNWERLKSSILEYLDDKELKTEFETVFGGGINDMYFAIFDPPADYDPCLGLLQDGPEYRGKPVLWAYMNPDGTVRVEETEFTEKYLYSAKALVAH